MGEVLSILSKKRQDDGTDVAVITAEEDPTGLLRLKAVMDKQKKKAVKLAEERSKRNDKVKSAYQLNKKGKNR